MMQHFVMSLDTVVRWSQLTVVNSMMGLVRGHRKVLHDSFVVNVSFCMTVITAVVPIVVV